MSIHKPHEALRADAVVLRFPPVTSGDTGRAFDLHPALFGLTVGGYSGFLAIMAATFMTAELAIPFAIFAVYLAMAFGVPALWATMAPPSGMHPQSWGRFMRDGIVCATGRIGGREAATQVLLMPALILFWGLGVAFIKAAI